MAAPAESFDSIEEGVELVRVRDEEEEEEGGQEGVEGPVFWRKLPAGSQWSAVQRSLPALVQFQRGYRLGHGFGRAVPPGSGVSGVIGAEDVVSPSKSLRSAPSLGQLPRALSDGEKASILAKLAAAHAADEEDGDGTGSWCGALGACCGEEDPPGPVSEAPWFILLPESRFRKVWEPLMLVPLLCVAVVIPLRVFFLLPPSAGWLAMDVVLYLAFSADICINFVSAIEDEATGEVEWRPRVVAWRYATGWFLLDLIGTIPLEYMLGSVSTQNVGVANLLLRVAKFPRAVRALRLTRLSKMIARARSLQGYFDELETEAAVSSAMVRLVASFFWAGISLHWASGIWYFTGRLNSVAEGGSGGWLEQFGLDQVELGEAYCWSLYFAVMTMTSVGYGDLSATNVPEACVAICMALAGLVWASVLVSNLTAVLSKLDELNAAASSKLERILTFLHNARAPRSLRQAVVAHVTGASKQDQLRAASTNDNAEILDALPTHLRRRLVLHTNRDILPSISLVNKASDAVRAAVAEKISLIRAYKGEVVHRQGAPSSDICFLRTGKVLLFWEDLSLLHHPPPSSSTTNSTSTSTSTSTPTSPTPTTSTPPSFSSPLDPLTTPPAALPPSCAPLPDPNTPDTDLRGKIALGELGPGAFFGEIGVVFDLPNALSALALQDSDLAVIPKEHFAEILQAFPKFAARLRQTVALRWRRLRSSLQKKRTEKDQSTPPPTSHPTTSPTSPTSPEHKDQGDGEGAAGKG